jgi:transcriptional regulator with XRE-family HTH domain
MNIEGVIGSRIAAARDRRGMSQVELGKRLGEWLKGEWSRQAVWAAERGQRAFTAAELVAFAHVLDVAVDHLLTPPIEVREIEMPSGATLDRSALTEATLPSDSTRELFRDMQESLGDLVTSLDAVNAARDTAGTLATQLEEAMALTRRKRK